MKIGMIIASAVAMAILAFGFTMSVHAAATTTADRTPAIVGGE